jgi:hypothetical protein
MLLIHFFVPALAFLSQKAHFLEAFLLYYAFRNIGFGLDSLKIRSSPVDPKTILPHSSSNVLRFNEREYQDGLLYKYLITKLLSLSLSHLPFLLEITLVSYYILFNMGISIFIYLLQPATYMFETGAICDIVNNSYAVSTSIVTACDSFKSILARCVPLNSLVFTICSFMCCPLTVKYFIF